MRVLLFIIVFSLVHAASDAEAQVGINVFGLSKHFNNSYDPEPHSINPGLGVHWTFDRGRFSALEINAGIYRDSFLNLNRHFSLGARMRVWGPVEIGLQSVLAKSSSMNRDNPLVYPVPFVSFRHPRFVLNTVYIPRVGTFNQIPTMALTATIFPFQDGFIWDDPAQLHHHRTSFLEFRLSNLTELNGYQGYGIAWRRMFNPRHGLRLGYELNGVIAFYGEGRQSGSYRTRVMAQYLRRFSADKRSGCIAGAGFRLGFDGYSRSALMQYQVVLNLGWEYNLSSKFHIFTETGLVISHYLYKCSDQNYSGSYSFDSRDGTGIHDAGVTIGITAGL